jgi:lipid-A-disaccharide synthase
MLSAGEASGDVHGAALCRALRTLEPAVELSGLGGPRMAAAGMRVIADVTDVATIGTSEVLGRLPRIVAAYRTLARALWQRRPSVLVLVDFPEFNLRLARTARRHGIGVVYFIPPQIWAWRGHRIHAIRSRVTLVLSIFPFEAALYRSGGVPAEFVGHPVLDAVAAAPDRAAARRQLGIEHDRLLVGLLPGSRTREIAATTPLLRDAAALIARARPEARFALGLAAGADRRAVTERLDGVVPIEVLSDRTYVLMRAADLLVVTSGTATLEAALLGTPMVVVYRASPLTILTGRLLLRVPWISLVNLTLGRGVVPEIWNDVTPATIAAAVLRLLASEESIAGQRAAFVELAGQLGTAGVAERAAKFVLAAAGRSA